MRGKHDHKTLYCFTIMLLTKWYIIIWGKLANTVMVQLQILNSRNFCTRILYYYYFFNIIFYQVNRNSLISVLFFLSLMLLYISWPTGPRFRESSNRHMNCCERENRTDKKQPVFESKSL